MVTALLADLVDRGLDTTGGVLFVLDGAKALTKAVRKVFGRGADPAVHAAQAPQRRRSPTGEGEGPRRPPAGPRVHPPRRRPGAAGCPRPRDLATSLQRTHPSAAASVREGLEEMFTVRRLGLSDALERTLTTTNPAESTISIARSTQRNVKNWKDASMARRWTAAGTLVAESNFRRLKGHKDMPLLVAALARHTRPAQAETVAATA